jgi:hypothetical protein
MMAEKRVPEVLAASCATAAAAAVDEAAQRRSRSDRRLTATPMLSRFSWWGGKRAAGRRTHERRNIYVDVHGPLLLAVVVTLTGLNFLDAYFTVLFLSYGGQELNPVVEALLTLGPWPFVLAKSLGVGVCVGFLTLTKNFLAARIGLGVLCVGYGALLAWHFYLLAHLPH